MAIGISLTVDYAFKRIFGHSKNKKILIAFLNDTMKLPPDKRIKKVTLKNPFSTKNFKSDKQNILDIRAEDNFGNQYDIEVQVVVHKSYAKRILHYACNMYVPQLKAGMSFMELKPVISINILDGVLFKGTTHYGNRFTLKNDECSLELTDDLCFYTFELPKFDIPREKLSTPIEEWLYLIKHSDKLSPSDASFFKDIPYEYIMEELKHMSQTDIEREQYEERLRSQSYILTIKEDYYSEGMKEGIKKGREEGREEGKEEGREEGEHKKAMETAKKMISKKIPISEISELTGLSEDEIKKL